MVEQHHADGAFVRLLWPQLVADLGKLKTGHDVGNHDNRIAVELANELLWFRLIGDAHDGVRV